MGNRKSILDRPEGIERRREGYGSEGERKILGILS
jgi:hypothetical protein